MTRKIWLIAGVASLALTGQAAAERGKDRKEAAQASQGGEQRKAERQQQRMERQARQVEQRRERQSFERPQRVERQRVQQAERQQRMERRLQQVEQRRERQRLDRPQRVERQQARHAERQQRIERRLQQVEQRRERQRIERPQRLERQRIQQAERQQRTERRLQQVEQRRERQRMERPQRLERERIKQAQRDQRMERRVLQAEQRIERQRERAERRQARAFDGGMIFDRRGERMADGRRFFRERSIKPMKFKPMKFKDDRRIVAIGQRIEPARYSSYVPTLYRTRYVDTPDYFYRYDDDLGYLYRIDRDDHLVRAMIPLFGGYGIGDPWPRSYYSSYVPLGYRDYYYDTPDYYHRYDGHGIYRIDAKTQLITALVALLTGQGLNVGQMLPASYGVYNVPMAYRSTYYDRDDAWYRYGDGFIYQVDPYSRRVAARYPIYGDDYDYMVGEPWPVAYPGYNVPYGYQSLYYDTPQDHYRYANGAIYRVDPTTQVIQALVALLSGQQPFAVGQAMPMAYSTYNVPFDYRDRYYDTDDAWYRYADGYVYEVDPDTGLIEESFPVYA